MDVYGTNLYPFPYTFKYPKAGETNATVSLHHYDLNSGTTQTIDLPEETAYYIPRIKFAPEADRLVVQTMNRLQNHLTLWQYRLSDKALSILLEEKSDTYVDIHDNLTFLEKGEFLWTSDRDGYNHIYHYDAAGKLKRQITQGMWEVTRFLGYNAKQKEIYYSSVEKSSIGRAVYSIGLNGKKKEIYRLKREPMGLRLVRIMPTIFTPTKMPVRLEFTASIYKRRKSCS